MLKCLAILTLATTTLAAQETPRVLRPGTRVEIGAVRGAVVATTPAMLVLRTEQGVDSLPLASITDWRWRATAAPRGAKIGLITGGVGVALLGALAGAGLCETDCSSAPMRGAAFGAALGSLVGAGAGALVGSLIPAWKTERGGRLEVAESPLATFPLKVNVARGVSSGAPGPVVQAGMQFVRGANRVGVEIARHDLGETNTIAFEPPPNESRPYSSTQVSRDVETLGLAVERRLLGGLWAEGAVTARRLRETTRVYGLADVGSPGISRAPVSSARDESAMGGSVGLVLRHRVIGDVWLRVNARQQFGRWSSRTLAAGVEL